MISRHSVEADLEQYRERLARCVQTGIRDFIVDNGDRLFFWRPGSVANVVRDYIVREIKREFPDGVDGIRHQERRGLFLLYIRDAYVLRFKKLGRGRRTMNHPTQLALDFVAQEPLRLFPDLEPALHLNVGYHAPATLATSTVWITCPNGDALQWEWQISEEADAVRFPTLTPATQPVPSGLRRPRARPRRAPETGVVIDGQNA